MFQFIFEDLLDSFQYLPVGITVGLLTIGIASLLNRRFDKNVPLFPLFLMGVYLTCLLYLVFLNREVGSRDGISLELFETLGNGIRGDSYVIENIMLFVPFGILLPWIFRHRPKSKGSFCLYIAAGCLTSIFIELVQLLTKLGYCQIDDIVMNTMGTFIGCLLCFLFSLLYNRK